MGRGGRQAAWHYVSSPARFWFDAITSIPFAWIDWSVYLVRARGRGLWLARRGPSGALRRALAALPSPALRSRLRAARPLGFPCA